jgi:hypothetical protein
MQDRPLASSRAALIAAACVLITLALPRTAHAQYNAPPLSREATGERYHVELSGTIWNPTLDGVVASEEFGLAGSDLNLVTDLGFQQTRFNDVRFVIRPARKHKFRFQYTPLTYTATSTLKRDVVFNGQKFTAQVPIASTFGWKVTRFGYEYDMVYRDRGFVGVFLEGRYTQFDASINSTVLGLSEFTSAKAPLPALGLAGRGYVAPNVAINFEVSGFNLPASASSKYQANYYDWDINTTVNLSNYFGVQVGWRRMTTFLNIDSDKGDFKFQGLYFGAAVRY